MVTRDFSGKDVYKVLVNVGGFRHVRTTGDHLILRWDPPESHETTDPRIVSVPAHDSISIGTLHDIAEDAGANDFETWLGDDSSGEDEDQGSSGGFLSRLFG